jgi:hypothetical protein
MLGNYGLVTCIAVGVARMVVLLTNCGNDVGNTGRATSGRTGSQAGSRVQAETFARIFWPVCRLARHTTRPPFVCPAPGSRWPSGRVDRHPHDCEPLMTFDFGQQAHCPLKQEAESMRGRLEATIKAQYAGAHDGLQHGAPGDTLIAHWSYRIAM